MPYSVQGAQIEAFRGSRTRARASTLATSLAPILALILAPMLDPPNPGGMVSIHAPILALVLALLNILPVMINR